MIVLSIPWVLDSSLASSFAISGLSGAVCCRLFI